MAQNARKNTVPFIKLNTDRVMPYEVEEVEKQFHINFNDFGQDINTFNKNLATLKTNTSVLGREIHEQSIQNTKRSLEIREQYSLFVEQPEIYARWMAIRDSSKTDIINTGTIEHPVDIEMNKTKISKDENGDLYLAVELLKPAETGFKIYDGKIEFSLEGMTADKMRAIIDYLERRGLASAVDYGALKILDEKGQEDKSVLMSIGNVDAKTEEMFEKIMTEKRDELATAEEGERDDFVSTESSSPSYTEEELANEAQAPAGNNNAEVHAKEREKKEISQPVDRQKAASELEKGKASIQKWANVSRKFGLTYFESYEDGFFCITTYKNENRKNQRKNGEIDKDGNVKVNYECKYYMRTNPKNGKLEVRFAMPPGGKMTIEEGDRVIEAFKAAGIKRVKFDPISPAYEIPIRESCARAMVVPVGIKLTKDRVDKMFEVAAKKSGRTIAIKYKYNLALQMASNLREKGVNPYDDANRNNDDCRAVRHTVLEYKLTPFRELWEDFNLRDKFEDIVNNSSNLNGEQDGAASTAGAGFAVSRLYDIYKKSVMPNSWYGAILSVDDTLKASVAEGLLNESEAKEFREILAKRNVDGKAMFRDINPEVKKDLFEIIHQTETDRARFRINEEYNRLLLESSSSFGESKKRRAIQMVLDNARTTLGNMHDDMKDAQLPAIVIIKFPAPNHDFDKRSKQEEANEKVYGENKRFGNNTAPHNSHDKETFNPIKARRDNSR